MQYSKRGFTLIELLVVIAIIGILATLVIVQLQGAQVRARNTTAKQDVTQMGKAIETWKTSNGLDNVANGHRGATTAINGTALTTTDTSVNGTNPVLGWDNAFKASVTGAYSVTITKSPSASYTYAYITSTDTAAGVGAAAGTPPLLQNINSAHYCVATNVVTSNGVSDFGFYINDGTSGNSTTSSVAATAANTSICQ